jgi:anaerobic selenocysteine-containing dehydrogenase
LANSLGLADFFPWGSVEEVLDVILDHPTTGHATVASLRAAGGFLPLEAPHVAYADRKFDSPSGKIEFYSSQAGKLGLPPLPVHNVDKASPYPLALSFGRTLTHFHSFYNEGRALPSLAKHNTAPQLWISRVDAEARQLSNMRLGSSMSGESSGQRPTSQTTCRRVRSGFAMDGSGSITSRMAMWL